MSVQTSPSPAERAAQEAIESIYCCINRRKSFVLEAGAGAGKTYSLVKALKYIIQSQGAELLRKNQRVACITYTNVAKNEIEADTDSHPVILSSTIHAFCWTLIKDFQPKLRSLLPSIRGWAERIGTPFEINNQTVKYDLGKPRLRETEIQLSHDDVLSLTTKLMEDEKFRRILVHRFPVLFIDEYQDTAINFVEALKTYFLEGDSNLLIGFFGDHWQKIYGTGCGKIEHHNLETISKRSNFRSVKTVVDCLNRMRPELPQEVSNPSIVGSVHVYHSNEWVGERLSKSHWKNDLPPEVTQQYLERVQIELANKGWDFTPDKTKILMLTHKVLAERQGYCNLADVFKYNDAYIKKEDEYIAFFADALEPICLAYEKREFGRMFSVQDGRPPVIRSHQDKIKLAAHMDTLLTLRKTGTVADVIHHLRHGEYPSLTRKLEEKEARFESLASMDSVPEEDKTFWEIRNKLGDILYTEIISLVAFIEERTPFATQHGVKGAEFENVLVVLGGGWNHYNFPQMLEYAAGLTSSGTQINFERSRNLFYVACSRPKKNLALLFTQTLSSTALTCLREWFGGDSIQSLQINDEG